MILADILYHITLHYTILYCRNLITIFVNQSHRKNKEMDFNQVNRRIIITEYQS